MNCIASIVTSALALVLLTPAALADGSGDYPWRDHHGPFDFVFGNMIDSHQQSRIIPTGELRGFLYIHDTGEHTEEGYPLAERARCPHEPCRLGWILKGVPVSATLMHKGPRTWLIDEDDLPAESGYRHFHWVGEPRAPSGLVIGESYSGFVMKRIAPEPFFWLGNTDRGRHGGRLVPEGVDAHSNIRTCWDGDDGGGCCGHDDGSCDHDNGDGGHDDDGGGCTGHDGGCTHDDGGCDGGDHDDGGGSHDDGGCGGHASRWDPDPERIAATLAAWGSCHGCPEDLDGNGAVDVNDLLLALTGPSRTVIAAP